MEASDLKPKLAVTTELSSKSFWDRVKEHGLAAVLLVAVLSVGAKVFLGNDAFLKEKLIDVIEEGNATDEKRVAADTQKNEIDRQQVTALVRVGEELDDITDTQRDSTKQLDRTNTNIERMLGIVEAHQEIEKAEAENP